MVLHAVPEFELAIAGAAGHGLAMQEPVTPHVPAVHSAPRAGDVDAVYPAVQLGVHAVAEAESATQLPDPPLATEGSPAHGLGLHVPATPQLPAVQVALSAGEVDAVYPLLHVGVHVYPDAGEEVQAATFPLVTVGRPAHGFGLHVPPIDHVPVAQVRNGAPEYPAMHA